LNPLMRLSLLLMCLITACTTTPATVVPTPTAEERIPTATALPPTGVALNTPEERGRNIFATFMPETGFSCATCHYTASDRRLIGPGLMNVGERAASNDLQMDAEAYLRVAIVAPDSFITPAEPPYPTGVMPQNYSTVLTPEQIEDLLAYLLSL
jgi:mono/diheme cytochrome c family protein